jgi:hypothetical protein
LYRQWHAAQLPPAHPAQPPEDAHAPPEPQEPGSQEPASQPEAEAVRKLAFDSSFSTFSPWQAGQGGAGAFAPTMSSKSLPHFLQRYS